MKQKIKKIVISVNLEPIEFKRLHVGDYFVFLDDIRTVPHLWRKTAYNRLLDTIDGRTEMITEQEDYEYLCQLGMIYFE